MMPTPDEWLKAVASGKVAFETIGRNQYLVRWGNDMLLVDNACRVVIPIKFDDAEVSDDATPHPQP